MPQAVVERKLSNCQSVEPTDGHGKAVMTRACWEVVLQASRPTKATTGF